MSRTLIKGAEAACPTTTGAASTFSSATVVRLVNTDSSAHLVTVVEEQSGTVVGSFTMPAGTVEFVEKTATWCIFAANAGVKGAAAGFTD
tara:strand:+ start:508 stop:777 length:270 start_codon:yes stop_codon:yes gene_type:complete